MIRKTIKIFFLLSLFGTLIGVGSVVALFYYYARDLPKITSLKDYHPYTMTEVFARDGELIGRFGIEKRKVVPIEEIPELMKKAFIASEDSRFYEHQGLDFLGITRAMIKNIEARRIVQGGSTITQQVTKALLLTPERKYKRKIKEAILAYRIEKYLSKDEILFIYLNQIYLGHGMYGVEMASQRYFGKKARDLNLAEISIIAGMPKAPTNLSPITFPKRSAARQRYVLGQMLEQKFITREQQREALLAKVVLVSRADPMAKTPYYTEHVRRYLEKKYGYDQLYKEGLQVYTGVDVAWQQAAQVGIDKELRELAKRRGFRGPYQRLTRVGERDKFIAKLKDERLELDNAGLVKGRYSKALVLEVDDGEKIVKLDLGGQPALLALKDMAWAWRPKADGTRHSRAKIKKPSSALEVGDVVLVRIKQVSGEVVPEIKVTLEEEPEAEAALFALEPKSGLVRAMVGGLDFKTSEFNRAIQSRRSPGSAFKPIIYAAGLDNGLTPASIFLDSPIIFKDVGDDWSSSWKPRNYEQKFYGPTTVRQALIHSRNLVTIKMLHHIGIKKVINYAGKLGITSNLNADLTLALGSSGVSLMELTTAYGVFANQGRLIKPIFVKRVEDRHGEVLEESERVAVVGLELTSLMPPDSKSVISPQTAYLMTSMLVDVVKRGTGRRAARALKRPLAGKTGTTNDYNDAWFMGYAPQLVAGVWVGFDDLKTLGRHETGSRTACPIWVNFMKVALAKMPPENFAVPAGIVFANIDEKTGLLAVPESEKTIFECFKEGTVPEELSQPVSPEELEESLFNNE
ncbi:MAG: PBP1A family penicillin-binding protein [Deltaproteobacteria bacterium]|nr:PBP1A family penicillin-binding protein [Deltaproteobacteria bacterium]